MELNPRQFFHGTDADISGEVVPGNTISRSNYGGARFNSENEYDAHSDYVYTTPDEQEAWNFAEMARASEPTKRARVYTVTPSPDVEKGPLHTDIVGEGGANEYRSKSATVNDTLWIPPPNPASLLPWEQGPQQGELPDEPWDQYYSEDVFDRHNAKELAGEPYEGTDVPRSPWDTLENITRHRAWHRSA